MGLEAPDEMMDAIQIRPPSEDGGTPSLVFTRCPRPVPTASEVLIRVHASKLNPSDHLNTKGDFPYLKYSDGYRIPGRDYAGVVVEAPSDPALVGCRVFGTSGNALGFSRHGSHAEYMTLPVDAVVHSPPNLTDEQGASLGVVYTTALAMVERARIRSYTHSLTHPATLIIGESGNVGTAVREIVTALHPEMRIEATKRRNGQIVWPENKKYDVIFSSVPSTQALQHAVDMLAPRGTLVFVAATRGQPSNLAIDPQKFYRDQLTICGVNSIDYTLYEVQKQLKEVADLSMLYHLASHVRLRAVPLRDALKEYQAGATDVLISMM